MREFDTISLWINIDGVGSCIEVVDERDPLLRLRFNVDADAIVDAHDHSKLAFEICGVIGVGCKLPERLKVMPSDRVALSIEQSTFDAGGGLRVIEVPVGHVRDFTAARAAIVAGSALCDTFLFPYEIDVIVVAPESNSLRALFCVGDRDSELESLSRSDLELVAFSISDGDIDHPEGFQDGPSPTGAGRQPLT